MSIKFIYTIQLYSQKKDIMKGSVCLLHYIITLSLKKRPHSLTWDIFQFERLIILKLYSVIPVLIKFQLCYIKCDNKVSNRAVSNIIHIILL